MKRRKRLFPSIGQPTTENIIHSPVRFVSPTLTDNFINEICTVINQAAFVFHKNNISLSTRLVNEGKNKTSRPRRKVDTWGWKKFNRKQRRFFFFSFLPFFFLFPNINDASTWCTVTQAKLMTEAMRTSSRVQHRTLLPGTPWNEKKSNWTCVMSVSHGDRAMWIDVLHREANEQLYRRYRFSRVIMLNIKKTSDRIIIIDRDGRERLVHGKLTIHFWWFF